MNSLLLDYLDANRFLLISLASASVVFLVIILFITPFIICAIPANYFEEKTRPKQSLESGNLVYLIAGICFKIVKNILGGMCVLAGIALLILPGQGLLTIFIGLLLMDYPGKYRLERKLISYSPILKIVNWIRIKGGKTTFDL